MEPELVVRPPTQCERKVAAVAERLLESFRAEEVTVRAAKPEPPIALPVDEVAVEVWKEG